MTLLVTQGGKTQVFSLCLTFASYSSIACDNWFLYISYYTVSSLQAKNGTFYCLLSINQHSIWHRIMAKYIFCWMAHQNTQVGRKSRMLFSGCQNTTRIGTASCMSINIVMAQLFMWFYWPSFQAWRKKYHILVGFLTLILFEREPTPLKLKYNSLVSWKTFSSKFYF